VRIDRSYVQFVLLLTGVGAALIGIGWWIAPKLGGPQTVSAMMLACGLSWIASVVGSFPQIFVRTVEQSPGITVLGSTAIRMGVTLAGILVIALGTEISKPVFLLWVAVSYGVFLIADVLFALRHGDRR